jgi:muramoyltetrapeptide carboxypeptidase
MKAPDFLKKKDKVAIIATAKNFDRKVMAAAVKQLQNWGLEVIEGKHLYKTDHQFAGTDKQRLEDLQWALDEKEIKAVFCARGGYGTARIIDEVDWKKFVKSPKWVIGFSDVTTLHAQIQKNKVKSIHGLMPISFSTKGYEPSLKKLQQLLFGQILQYKILSNELNRIGAIEAELTGGNLSIICSLIGTDSEIKTENRILFIEEVGENLYRVDRMMNQLKRAGFLKSLSGLIVGHFTDMEDNPVKFGKNAYEIIAEAVKEYKYPVCYGFPAGHEADNFPLVLGAEVKLSVQKKYTTIG